MRKKARAFYEETAAQTARLRQESPQLRDIMHKAEASSQLDGTVPYTPSPALNKLLDDAMMMQHSLFVQSGRAYDAPNDAQRQEDRLNKDGEALGCIMLEALYTSEMERAQQKIHSIRAVKEEKLTEALIAHTPSTTSWQAKVAQKPQTATSLNV